jgi:hypothetical protein
MTCVYQIFTIEYKTIDKKPVELIKWPVCSAQAAAGSLYCKEHAHAWALLEQARAAGFPEVELYKDGRRIERGYESWLAFCSHIPRPGQHTGLVPTHKPAVAPPYDTAMKKLEALLARVGSPTHRLTA